MCTSRPSADSYAEQMSDAGLPSFMASNESELQATKATPSALASILERIAETEMLLSDVERALERLEAGSYNLCEVCGNEIEPGRLDTSPVTRRCESHASERL